MYANEAPPRSLVSSVLLLVASLSAGLYVDIVYGPTLGQPVVRFMIGGVVVVATLLILDWVRGRIADRVGRRR